ncbi:MAG TPA: aminotransferase class I/II-fold pyridoxal phosphate-dependent enzyme [Opitutaceae bacterium]|nr:aminotransferase class I/II-fold pyridoxal phosphate-dependent enzyme [Opitutaceae bacterium]
MRAILVTGSDTGVGKTHATAALARLLAAGGARVQIVKVVETGALAGNEGDAARAQRLAGGVGEVFTLASFPVPIAPASAAALAGQKLSLEILVERACALPVCDWRIFEGAGGIATPIDARARDWADFAAAIEVDAVVIVVPDRLGAINQARLAFARASSSKLHAGVWLNATAPVGRDVADSTRAGLRAAGVPLWAEQAYEAALPNKPDEFVKRLNETAPLMTSDQGLMTNDTRSTGWLERCRRTLAERDEKKLRRTLRVTARREGDLNLADNDYLDLARDPALAAAVVAAVAEHGTSASASPLITGWREPHARLVEALCGWHGFPCGMLWSSGYAANSAVLGGLPARGDLVLADRLIHHSMVAGLLRSGARLQRYEHLNLDQLEEQLARAQPSGRTVFVVTESVFSMDGDYPDLVRMADLKRRHEFCWVVDEAHALGWYGPEGAGLVRAAGVEPAVDILVGTLGKTLAAGGAYTLFREEAVRDYFVNTAGEFIYSTGFPPANAAAALAALGRLRALAGQQADWQERSRVFRSALQAAGWQAPAGESPVVPVRLDDEDAALALAGALREAGIYAAAVRPPTVPAGTSRLRFSLKRTFTRADMERVLAAMAAWRARR